MWPINPNLPPLNQGILGIVEPLPGHALVFASLFPLLGGDVDWVILPALAGKPIRYLIVEPLQNIEGSLLLLTEFYSIWLWHGVFSGLQGRSHDGIPRIILNWHTD